MFSIMSQQIARIKTPNDIGAVVGPFCDAESLTVLKDLLNKLNSELLCTEESFPTEGAR